MDKTHPTRLPPKLVALAALALTSALCCGLYAARVIYTGRLSYALLVWNLFLAWVPLVFALAAHGLHRTGRGFGLALALPFAGLWLLFLPNAPYVLTDLTHLGAVDGAPRWFDVMLLFAFGWTGLMLGFVSLYLMHDLVDRVLGRAMGWLFVLATLALSSFGIYLGRFERWNSWDLVFNTEALLRDIYFRLRHPLSDPRTLVFSIIFTVFFLTAYLILMSFARLQADRRVPATAPALAYTAARRLWLEAQRKAGDPEDRLAG